MKQHTILICSVCKGRMEARFAAFPNDADTLTEAIRLGFHRAHGRGLTFEEVERSFRPVAERLNAKPVVTPHLALLIPRKRSEERRAHAPKVGGLGRFDMNRSKRREDRAAEQRLAVASAKAEVERVATAKANAEAEAHTRAEAEERELAEIANAIESETEAKRVAYEAAFAALEAEEEARKTATRRSVILADRAAKAEEAELEAEGERIKLVRRSAKFAQIAA